MKKYLAVFMAMAALLVGTPSAEASHVDRIEFMSQNLYIGADISRILAGEPPGEVLQTVIDTNYPARAAQIAQAIDDFNPDLVGLQEVTELTTTNGLDLDFLEILMTELAKVDDRYEVAAVVENANITLPLLDGEGNFGTVIDRDVILFRNTTTKVDRSTTVAENFKAVFTPSFGGFPIPFKRGYVGLDVSVKGHEFHFVNTHLEVEPDFQTGAGLCLDLAGNVFVCQDDQADELVEVLAGSAKPVVLVGDINAVPDAPAYGKITDAGYTDTWTIRLPYPRESGYTCCQDEDLQNVESNLTQRIDHIFIEDSIDPILTRTTVVGDWEERKTDTDPPLWYSDHGGPWARLYLTS